MIMTIDHGDEDRDDDGYEGVILVMMLVMMMALGNLGPRPDPDKLTSNIICKTQARTYPPCLY